MTRPSLHHVASAVSDTGTEVGGAVPTPSVGVSSSMVVTSGDDGDAAGVTLSESELMLMFPDSHITQPSALLAVYFPIGCALAAFRMALWVALLGLDLPITDNDAAIAVLRTMLGVSVTWEGTHRLPAGKHVMVSNHLTAGDLIILYMLPRRYIHLITPALPEKVAQVKNHRVLLRQAKPAVYEELAAQMEPSGSSQPVHLFPEGGMSSGSSMLRFSRGFVRFSRSVPVAPMALRMSTPLPGVSTHTLTSSFLANLFWFSFLPWIHFRCTVLDPVQMEPDESPGRFANRIQQAIAAELQIPISDINIQQKKQIVKDRKRQSGRS